jgi:hypothetical protein
MKQISMNCNRDTPHNQQVLNVVSVGRSLKKLPAVYAQQEAEL